MSDSRHPSKPDRWWKGQKRGWRRQAKRRASHALRIDNVEAVPVVNERRWQVGWP